MDRFQTLYEDANNVEVSDTLAVAKEKQTKFYRNTCSKHGKTVFYTKDNSCPYCVKEARDKRHKKDKKYNKARVHLNQIRKRCKERGTECTLTNEDVRELFKTEFCPVLGIKICYDNKEVGDNSLSIDRLDPSKGYHKDNVVLMSNRANRLKSDGTLEEHLKVVEFMRKITAQTSG